MNTFSWWFILSSGSCLSSHKTRTKHKVQICSQTILSNLSRVRAKWPHQPAFKNLLWLLLYELFALSKEAEPLQGLTQLWRKHVTFPSVSCPGEDLSKNIEGIKLDKDRTAFVQLLKSSVISVLLFQLVVKILALFCLSKLCCCFFFKDQFSHPISTAYPFVGFSTDDRCYWLLMVDIILKKYNDVPWRSRSSFWSVWLLLSLCLFLAFCVWCVFGSWHVLCPLYSPFFSVTCTFPDCHISVSCVHLICPACLSLLIASSPARNILLPVSDYSVWISGSETILGLWPLLYHFCIWLNDGKCHYIHCFPVPPTSLF